MMEGPTQGEDKLSQPGLRQGGGAELGGVAAPEKGPGVAECPWGNQEL